MNKSDLIVIVAQKLSMSNSEAERTVNTILDCIRDGLKTAGRVTLTGFGSFDLRTRKEREGRNPQTGAVIRIPPSKTVGFKPGKNWKEEL